MTYVYAFFPFSSLVPVTPTLNDVTLTLNVLTVLCSLNEIFVLACLCFVTLTVFATSLCSLTYDPFAFLYFWSGHLFWLFPVSCALFPAPEQNHSLGTGIVSWRGSVCVDSFFCTVTLPFLSLEISSVIWTFVFLEILIFALVMIDFVNVCILEIYKI